jgi:hypothetical protein
MIGLTAFKRNMVMLVQFIKRCLSLSYIRAAFFAALLGCLLTAVVVTVGTDDKSLAKYDPRLENLFISGHRVFSQQLLDRYDRLVMLRTAVEMFPYFVVLPSVVVGYVGFSCAALDRWFNRPLRITAKSPYTFFEKTFYALSLTIFVCQWLALTPAAYRGWVINMGVPNSRSSQLSEEFRNHHH